MLESDVEKCFESIERPRALRELEVQLGDKRALDLAARWLENPTDWGAGPIVTELGITQGDLISPFVCNVLLDRFDADLLAKGLRPVRYADDFVVPFRHRRHADQALRDASDSLGALGLNIAHRKTRLTSFEAGFDFLGTLFVGSLAMPRHRVETDDGRAYYSVGYEARRPRPTQQRWETRAFLV